MEQLVDLDNDLRKEREHGIPRSIHLAGLNKLKDLPKPWHREFWNDLPDDLPFDVQPLPKSKSVRNSMISNGNSEWEWEYYSQSEEDEFSMPSEE